MHPLCWLHSKAVQISDHDWTLTFLCTCSYARIALLAALAPNHAQHGPSTINRGPTTLSPLVINCAYARMAIRELMPKVSQSGQYG